MYGKKINKFRQRKAVISQENKHEFCTSMLICWSLQTMAMAHWPQSTHGQAEDWWRAKTSNVELLDNQLGASTCESICFSTFEASTQLVKGFINVEYHLPESTQV